MSNLKLSLSISSRTSTIKGEQGTSTSKRPPGSSGGRSFISFTEHEKKPEDDNLSFQCAGSSNVAVDRISEESERTPKTASGFTDNTGYDTYLTSTATDAPILVSLLILLRSSSWAMIHSEFELSSFLGPLEPVDLTWSEEALWHLYTDTKRRKDSTEQDRSIRTTDALQFINQMSINYGGLLRMEDTINLGGHRFSWIASIFYFGYMIAQEPAAYALGRFPAGKVLGICVLAEGILTITSSRMTTYKGIMVCRFFSGVFDAVITPGLSLMTGFWYTRSEIPIRESIWYGAVPVAGMFGALITATIYRLDQTSSLPPWSAFYLFFGILCCAWSSVPYFFLADSPASAKWLKPEDRIHAVARVASSGVGIKSGRFKTAQMWEALKDAKCWCMTIGMLGSSVPNAIFSNYSERLIKDLGELEPPENVLTPTENEADTSLRLYASASLVDYSREDAALLDAAGRGLQLLSLLLAGYIASRYTNTRLLMATIGNVICVLAAIGYRFFPSNVNWLRAIFFLCTNLQSIGFVFGLFMISSNIGGWTKKSTTSAMVFLAYCIGNIVGPQLVTPSDAPNYHTAAIGMMIGYMIRTIAYCILWYIMWKSNQDREKVVGPADEKQASLAGMQDLTERENRHFRYVL